ncbi:MAG: RNA polymerase sigma factor, partial [Rhodospirillaceae bacterium]
MPEQLLSDAELLSRAGAGDEGAFTDLYRRRQAGLYRFAFQMSGSGVVAEDVVQEVFLALIRGTARYDAARGSVAAFLYGIARKQVLKALERDARTESAEGSDFAAPADVAGDVERSRTVEAVREAVLALPVHYREVVVLCDVHGMEYAEAAAA